MVGLGVGRLMWCCGGYDGGFERGMPDRLMERHFFGLRNWLVA